MFMSFGFVENEIGGEDLLGDRDGGLEEEDNDHIG